MRVKSARTGARCWFQEISKFWHEKSCPSFMHIPRYKNISSVSCGYVWTGAILCIHLHACAWWRRRWNEELRNKGLSMTNLECWEHKGQWQFTVWIFNITQLEIQHTFKRYDLEILSSQLLFQHMICDGAPSLRSELMRIKQSCPRCSFFQPRKTPSWLEEPACN